VRRIIRNFSNRVDAVVQNAFFKQTLLWGFEVVELFIHLTVNEALSQKAALEMEPFQAWWSDGLLFCMEISSNFSASYSNGRLLSLAQQLIDSPSCFKLNNLQ